jgi:hypothetical protein
VKRAALLGAALVVMTIGLTEPAEARVRGQVRLENNGPSTQTEDSDEQLVSGVTVGGNPYEVMCASRQPATATTSEPEDEYGNVVEEYYDSETKTVRTRTVQKVKRRYVYVTLTCGRTVLRTSKICVPNVGFDPCTPPPNNLNGKEVAVLTPVGWPEVTASMSPNARGRRRYDFALAQAPFFFWFEGDNFDDVTSHSFACSGDVCAKASVVANSIATVFTPDLDDPDAEMWCWESGKAVRTPADYEAGWKDIRNPRSDGDPPSEFCSHTYKRSSTKKPNGVYRARIGVIYELTRTWEVKRVTDDALLDGGKVVEDRYVRVTWDEFSARVGEAQGVNS